jgi:pentatricopeptide repeat protein
LLEQEEHSEWPKWADRSERMETAARPRRGDRGDHSAPWPVAEQWDDPWEGWDYREPPGPRGYDPPNGREFREYQMDRETEYHNYSMKEPWRDIEYERRDRDYRRDYELEPSLHRNDVQKGDESEGASIVAQLMHEVRSGKPLMIENYRQALTVCARMGESAAAEEVFGFLVADGIEPDLYCYKAVIAANQRRHEWAGVLRFCDKMHEAHLFADAVTYTAILTSLYKGGQFQLVLDRFAKFQSLGCVLDVYSYNVAISTCAKLSNLQLALKCWEDLKARNITPIATVYDGIIITSVNCGSVDVAHRLLMEMEENGFELTQQIRVAKTYVLAKQGVVTAAVESLETQAARNDTVAVGVVRAVLSSIRKAGRVDILPRVIRLMRVCSVEPDEDCYMQIITTYIMAARVDEASIVVLRMLHDSQGFAVPMRVLEAIVRAAVEKKNPKPALAVLKAYEKSDTPSTYIDLGLLAQLLDALLTAEPNQEEISAFFDEQCKKKSKSSQEMCSALLPEAEAGNCWKCAQFLLSKIESDGCELNAQSYEVAIRICERSGEEALAQHLRDELRSLSA